jgi:tetraprenyl-beta-curcumene synthase
LFDDIAVALRTVLGSRERLRALVALGPAMPLDIVRFLMRIVPIAAASLAAIRDDAARIPDDRLRHEALASIDGKAYHVAGACILATFLDGAKTRAYIDIVAPLETIYDYLDNLCDRHPEVTHDAYPVLHQAIADALDPNAEPRDYYAAGPPGEDGGYLRRLVARTQSALRGVPHEDRLRRYFAEAAELYAAMQTYKHLPRGERELACVAWYESHRARFSELDWHEFACAAGSQFQVYGPLYAAFAGKPDEIGPTYDAYFPYLSALHVLLDSFIDQAEDRAFGELNFAAVYGGAPALQERMRFMARTARARFGGLSDPYRHRFVLEVMMLFYLSHAKISAQKLDREARALLRANGGYNE